MSENIIELKNISKQYDDNTVLDNLSLNIRKNEFVTLLGPSGCGKTTTLKIIAGFETADSGSIMFKNKDISDVPPYKRQLNTVFQKYALFPHMNVYENIAFGLKIKKLSKDEIDKKVKEMLRMVSLSGFEKRSIESLSGGQQQRVAIARALINKPAIILADEPTGNLDSETSKEIMEMLKLSVRKYNQTAIVITHDLSIAENADRVIKIKDGKVFFIYFLMIK